MSVGSRRGETVIHCRRRRVMAHAALAKATRCQTPLCGNGRPGTLHAQPGLLPDPVFRASRLPSLPVLASRGLGMVPASSCTEASVSMGGTEASLLVGTPESVFEGVQRLVPGAQTLSPLVVVGTHR